MALKRSTLLKATSDDQSTKPKVAEVSKEIVIGLVSYAGAGCSTAGGRLRLSLEDAGYVVRHIKLSQLIPFAQIPMVKEEGINRGKLKFERAEALQDLGDQFREEHGGHAVASAAAGKIRNLRDGGKPGEERIAFILDSIKHEDEVSLLRQVYERSFRLMAVHCERSNREERLIGKAKDGKKYSGVSRENVLRFMDRDQGDDQPSYGQHVRDAFCLADFFIDNNVHAPGGANLTKDLERFVNLVLGKGLVRPTPEESGMYHAHAAANQSSCLSRQVGAALLNEEGTVVSTGTNEVPKFGGGVYVESDAPDNRCHAWEWKASTADGEGGFKGCHNQRQKKELRDRIGNWLAEKIAPQIADTLYSGQGLLLGQQEEVQNKIKKFFQTGGEKFEKLPGVKDLVEYSRSIHAEMSALFNAARSGGFPKDGKLFCTTYPCHNCARHLIMAGITEVQYIEPYVKSLAYQLHYDAISTERLRKGSVSKQKMLIVPFTGVGPRMYEDYFKQHMNMKNPDGSYRAPDGQVPDISVRIQKLADVEKKAADLISDGRDG